MIRYRGPGGATAAEGHGDGRDERTAGGRGGKRAAKRGMAKGNQNRASSDTRVARPAPENTNTPARPTSPPDMGQMGPHRAPGPVPRRAPHLAATGLSSH